MSIARSAAGWPEMDEAHAPRSRGLSAITGSAVGIVGIAAFVASIESIGLVGETDTEVSWPLALPAVGLLALAPAVAVRVRRRSWGFVRPSITFAGSLVAAVVIGAASGSVALAALAWLVVGTAIAVV